VGTNAKNNATRIKAVAWLILRALSDFLAEMAQRDVHSYSSCLLCFVSVVAIGNSNPDPEIDQMLGGLGQEI
jgi:hypothetical protein